MGGRGRLRRRWGYLLGWHPLSLLIYSAGTLCLLPEAGREDEPGDRRGSRRETEADRSPSARCGEDPGPAPLDASRAGEEVTGAAPPRGEQGDAPDLLRRLRPIRRRLPHGRREAQEGRSQPGLPAGVLPTGVAVRGRIGQAPRFRPEDWVDWPPE